MDKRLLILQACGIKSEQYEITNIENQAKSYFIEVDKFCPKNSQELHDVLESRRGIEYDYIYLSSHGDEWGFANEDDSLNVDWVDFGVRLCDVMCMKKDCVVMLSCCRGGLNQVVYSLFATCGKIGYIIGPRQSLDPKEMAISFSLFLFNREFRDLDPIVACEKIKCGADIRFVCFDSLETRGEAGFLQFQRKNFGDDESEDQLNQLVTAVSDKVIANVDEWIKQKSRNGLETTQVGK